MSITNIADLDERIASLTKAAQDEALATWRSWANQADITNARRGYPQAIAAQEAALIAQESARAEVKVLRDRLADALADTEDELEDRFVKDGSKHYIVDGQDVAGNEVRKQVLADEWKAARERAAAKHPAVVAVQAKLDAAEWDLSMARVAVTTAEARVSAAKAELQAAIAVLQTQAAAHPRGNTQP